VELNMIQCGLCGTSFPFGPHRYDGKYLPHYELHVCRTCLDSNWDGIASHHEEKLVAHLKNRGIPLPARNANGGYPLTPK
jgi:hypothetical protein